MTKTDRRLIHELPCGGFRDATPDEIAAAEATEKRADELRAKVKALNAELTALTAECEHTVCYDQPGFTFDVRTCVACGYISFL